jgi:hypothetical protein
MRRITGGERILTYPQLYTLVHRIKGVAVTPESWRTEIADLID